MTVPSEKWPLCFPELSKSSDPAISKLLKAARTITLQGEEFVFHTGAPCHRYLLSVEGTIRVQLTAESGRELTLYRVKSGGSCILTTSCLLGGEHYPAEGIAETNVTAFAIDRREFEQTLDESAEFRRFVFANFSKRLADVIRRIEAVTFTPIDTRLARVLLDCGASAQLSGITHQGLAVELGTAREVVSRHLKRFESRGWISLGRGQIEITDRASLIRVRDTDLK